MLKAVPLALVLIWQAVPYRTLEEYRGAHTVSCDKQTIPPGFACAIIMEFDPPIPDGIASITGGEYDAIRGISVMLPGTVYTAAFDPPLKRDEQFPTLSAGERGILARVDGDYLIVRWAAGKEAKGRITRRERVGPNRPRDG